MKRYHKTIFLTTLLAILPGQAIFRASYAPDKDNEINLAVNKSFHQRDGSGHSPAAQHLDYLLTFSHKF